MNEPIFSIKNLLSLIVGISLVILPTGFHIVDIPPVFLSSIYWLFPCCVAGLILSFYLRLSVLPVFLLIICGILRGLDVAEHVASHLLRAELDDREFILEGVITGLPKEIESYGRQGKQFDFQLTDYRCAHPQNPCADQKLRRVRLRWYDNPDIHSGEKWQFNVSLRRPRGLSNPAGMDYEVWLVQQGFSATGKVLNGVRLGPANNALMWRESITDTLKQRIGELNNKGILEALINGNNAAISPELWTIFSQTNTTHLFVISGLHLSLVGGLVWWFARRIVAVFYPYPPHISNTFAAILAWIFAVSYALLAGWAIPVQRALVLFTFVLFVYLWRRSLHAGQSILLLLAICIFVDPLCLLSMSFWLSWSAGAVLLLCLIGRKNNNKWMLWLRSQWVIFIGLMPILVAAIGQMTALGFIANLIAIPVINLVIVPLNLLALLCSTLAPEIASLVWLLLDKTLDGVLRFLQLLSAEGKDLIWHPSYTLMELALFSIGVLIFLLPKGVTAKPIALFCFLPIFLHNGKNVQANELHVTVFDVGQGLSVLMQVENKTVLYDTGPPLGPTLDAGNTVILPFLRQQGISKLDYLIVSHVDADHSGGLHSIVDGMTVGELISSESLAPLDTRLCNTSVSFRLGNFRFEFIHPNSSSTGRGTTNNQSCVLRVSHSDSRDQPAVLLLPGDIEKKNELELLRTQRRLLSSQLIFMPHHGSRTSSTSAFIKAVNPQWAIASAGYRHKYGHPHTEIVRRYKDNNVSVLNTADTGAISMAWRQSSWQIHEFERFKRAYFWQ